MSSSHALSFCVAWMGMLPLLIWISLRDLATRTLPNWSPLAVTLLSLSMSALSSTLPSAVAAGATIAILAAFCWRAGWMGGGDVKLLSAAGFGMTPATVPEFILIVALVGGVLALIYLGAKHLVPAPTPKRSTRSLLWRVLRAEQWRVHRGCPLPYAIAIAIGTMCVQL